MQEYFLVGKGGQKAFFQLPGAWKVLTNAVIAGESVKQSIYKMVGEALEKPIGSAPLAKLVKSTDKVAIIIDDFTRPTPKREILSCLLDHLDKYGVAKKQIDVIFATGTHRPVSRAEIEENFGSKLSQEIRFSNHDCRSPELVSVGRLKYMGELKLNPLVVKADLRIGIGSIIPHPMNGFGGGAKIVFPGISNYEAIRNHHCALMIAKGASLGNIRNNPYRNEICEAGRLAKLDFIINAFYNSNEDVKGIAAGHFEKAQEFGADMTLKELAVDFNEVSDVTIVSAFPYTEGTQVMKPLGPATMITKMGGIVILYASAIEGGGFPTPFLEAFDFALANSRGEPKQLVLNSLRNGKPIIPAAPMDLNAALNITLLYLSRVKVLLVSKDADEKQAARLGFDYVKSLDEAIEIVAKQNPMATVNLLPAGGLVIPLVKNSLSFD
jgi:nickel-dependent lactate racemase